MYQYSNQAFANGPPGRSRRTRQNASQLVLKSPELLARILSFLDIRDLLISAQRINHTWHKIITKNSKLQEALFFKFPPPNSPRLVNPLLKEFWPLWFKSPSSFNKRRPRPRASDFRFLKWSQRPSAFRRRNASWRRMLVVSGGNEVTALKVRLQSQSWLGWQESQGVLMCPDGLRMGTLWDFTKDWCMYDEDATFLVNWDAELVSNGRETLGPNSNHADSGRWKHKLKKIFIGNTPKKGFTDISLKSASSHSTVSTDGSSESGQEKYVELILQYSIGLEDPSMAAATLGPDFQSEAYEKVNIEYGKSREIPGP